MQSCNERINENLEDRIKDIRILWSLYCKDPDASDENLGSFDEYGLCFDYVRPYTFTWQREAYFTYQLSCGGPSDEFKFFVNPDFSVHRIEYWFLDWFDGAKREFCGKDFELLLEIFEFFKECGTVEHVYRLKEKELEFNLKKTSEEGTWKDFLEGRVK